MLFHIMTTTTLNHCNIATPSLNVTQYNRLEPNNLPPYCHPDKRNETKNSLRTVILSGNFCLQKLESKNLKKRQLFASFPLISNLSHPTSLQSNVDLVSLSERKCQKATETSRDFLLENLAIPHNKTTPSPHSHNDNYDT